MMYDELIKQLRECTAEQNGEKTLWCKAADAIEELSMKLHGDEAAILGMKREIERMVVNGTHRWIPVTERLPREMETVLVTDGKNVGWSFCVNDYGTMEFYSASTITHWMPLPEPPEEGE